MLPSSKRSHLRLNARIFVILSTSELPVWEFKYASLWLLNFEVF